MSGEPQHMQDEEEEIGYWQASTLKLLWTWLSKPKTFVYQGRGTASFILEIDVLDGALEM